MKIIDIYAHFTDEDWRLLRSIMSETEIKRMLTKAMDKAISMKCDELMDFIPENQQPA